MEHNSTHGVEADSVWKGTTLSLSHFKWNSFKRLKMLYEEKDQVYQFKAKSDHSIKKKILIL